MSKFLERFFNRKVEPPTISTQWGPVSEPARLQAIANMRADRGLRERVEQVVINEMGGDRTRGMVEFRRRYRELFEED